MRFLRRSCDTLVVAAAAAAAAAALTLSACGDAGDDSESGQTSAGFDTTSESSSASTGALSTGTTGGPDATSSSSGGASSTSTTSGESSGGTGATTSETSETSAGTTGAPLEPCNGHVVLCDRPFDQVVFPTTHNSNSALSDGYSQIVANHTEGIGPQLEHGIRGMLIDVHDHQDAVHMCHGTCTLGNQLHTEGLEIIRDFLEQHPREVLAIIYQDEVGVDAVVADYEATGLIEQVYAHPDGTPWPTLGELIEADTRLVVTAENGGPPPAWYHHVWDVAWDTPYSFMDPDEFSCELNRGSQDNDLFLMNHWVNNLINLPSEDNAAIVNAFDVLHGRALECAESSGKMPNFIAVDFFLQGDVVAVADALNLDGA